MQQEIEDKMKKFTILLTGILAAIMLTHTPEAEARWRIGDQIRMVTGNINAGVSQLRGQIGTPSGLAGVYSVVGRHNDIFVFCKEGMPMHGWIGVNPSTGQYQILNWWTVNWTWIPYYVVLCPFGGQAPGNWQGPGSGAAFKGNPSGTPPLIPFAH